MGNLKWPDLDTILARNGVTWADVQQSQTANQFLALMHSMGKDVPPSDLGEPLDDDRRMAVGKAQREYLNALPSQVQAIITQTWAAELTLDQARAEIEKLQRA
jgi:hypothetical protein